MSSFWKILLGAVCTYACATNLAFSDIVVSFDESAPKDRFTFANKGNCKIDNAKLTLDLSGSKAGLLFDVTARGAGVEVFQPIEFVAGASTLRTSPKIDDGDSQVTLDIRQLVAGQSIAFTIDVDDTMGGREITVSNSEIEGAKVRFADSTGVKSTEFDRNATATLELKNCLAREN